MVCIEDYLREDIETFDVYLSNGKPYRVFREPRTGHRYIEVYDDEYEEDVREIFSDYMVYPHIYHNENSLCGSLIDDDIWERCENCGEIFLICNMTEVHDGDCVCQDCLEEHYVQCDVCGDWCKKGDINTIHTSDDHYFCCEDCAHYAVYRNCAHCGEWVHEEYMRNTYDDELVCDRCIDNNYTYCDDVVTYVINDDAYYDEEDGCFYRCDTGRGRGRGRGRVRSYHQNPEIVYHDNRNHTTDGCYIGCEIEMEGNGKIAKYVQRIDITNKYGHSEEYIYQMRDGSLNSSGIECITMPMGYEFWKSFNFEGWFKELSDVGTVSDQSRNNNCGLHIHLSRKWFGDNVAEQIRVAGCVIHIMDNFKGELDVLARRTNHRWCQYPCEVGSENTFIAERLDWSNYHYTIGELTDLVKGNKYRALNCQHNHTFEFRIFKGSINPLTYRASVELCLRLVDYAKHKLYVERDYVFSWRQFMEYKPLPTTLAEYIEIRKTKRNGHLLNY